MAAPAGEPLPPAPPMPPPMHVIMKNKSRNYDCYKKQSSDGTVTYGFVVRRYQSPTEGEKAIFVYNKNGVNQADHVKMAKLELTDREQCADIPNQDKLMLYNEGGVRRTVRRRRQTNRRYRRQRSRRHRRK